MGGHFGPAGVARHFMRCETEAGTLVALDTWRL